MSQCISITPAEEAIAQKIEQQVQEVLTTNPFRLTKSNHPLVMSLQQQIDDRYAPQRIGGGTILLTNTLYVMNYLIKENAPSLMQQFEAVVNSLITRMQYNEIATATVREQIQRVVKFISDIFPDWQDAREEDDFPYEVSNFINKDLPRLLKALRERADNIARLLHEQAQGYQPLQQQTEAMARKASDSLLASVSGEPEAEVLMAKITAAPGTGWEQALIKHDGSDKTWGVLTITGFDALALAVAQLQEKVQNLSLPFEKMAQDLDQHTLRVAELSDLIQSSPDSRQIKAVVINEIDEMLVRLHATWQAYELLHPGWREAFSAGWSAMNKMLGAYISKGQYNDRLPGLVQQMQQARAATAQ